MLQKTYKLYSKTPLNYNSLNNFFVTPMMHYIHLIQKAVGLKGRSFVQPPLAQKKDLSQPKPRLSKRLSKSDVSSVGKDYSNTFSKPMGRGSKGVFGEG